MTPRASAISKARTIPKIRFYKTIKEIEARLADPAVTLNSFIISNTPHRDVGWWDGGITKAELEKCHVLFQKEGRETYIKRLLLAVAK